MVRRKEYDPQLEDILAEMIGCWPHRIHPAGRLPTGYGDGPLIVLVGATDFLGVWERIIDAETFLVIF